MLLEWLAAVWWWSQGSVWASDFCCPFLPLAAFSSRHLHSHRCPVGLSLLPLECPLSFDLLVPLSLFVRLAGNLRLVRPACGQWETGPRRREIRLHCSHSNADAGRPATGQPPTRQQHSHYLRADGDRGNGRCHSTYHRLAAGCCARRPAVRPLAWSSRLWATRIRPSASADSPDGSSARKSIGAARITRHSDCNRDVDRNAAVAISQSATSGDGSGRTGWLQR